MVEDANNNKNQIPVFRHYEASKLGKVHHFYISGHIQDPPYYIDMIHRIRTASVVDHVYIHLNTPGGNAFTGVQIMGAIQASEAHIVTSMEGQVASLGSMIFLCGHEYVVYDHSLMLIHNHSGGQQGKGHEYLAQAIATTKLFEKTIQQIYKFFLTDEEIQLVLDGKDYWFDSDEVRKRLKKMVSGLNKAEKEAIKNEK